MGEWIVGIFVGLGVLAAAGVGVLGIWFALWARENK